MSTSRIRRTRSSAVNRTSGGSPRSNFSRSATVRTGTTLEDIKNLICKVQTSVDSRIGNSESSIIDLQHRYESLANSVDQIQDTLLTAQLCATPFNSQTVRETISASVNNNVQNFQNKPISSLYKLKDIVNHFDGRNNPIGYITSLKRVIDNNTRLFDIINIIRATLKGYSLTWFELIQDQINSFEEFERLFVEQYLGIHEQDRLKVIVFNQKYNPRSAISRQHYFLDLYYKAKFLLPEWSEIDLIKNISKHYDFDVYKDVITKRISTSQEFITLLKDYDIVYNFKDTQNTLSKYESHQRSFSNNHEYNRQNNNNTNQTHHYYNRDGRYNGNHNSNRDRQPIEHTRNQSYDKNNTYNQKYEQRPHYNNYKSRQDNVKSRTPYNTSNKQEHISNNITYVHDKDSKDTHILPVPIDIDLEQRNKHDLYQIDDILENNASKKVPKTKTQFFR